MPCPEIIRDVHQPRIPFGLLMDQAKTAGFVGILLFRTLLPIRIHRHLHNHHHHLHRILTIMIQTC